MTTMLHPRFRQLATAVRATTDADVDRRLRAGVNDAQWQLLARTTPFDRAHMLAVHERLRAAGESDPDLLLAGLLHDVGKADERMHVGVTHRVALVLLRPIARRVACENGDWLRHGLWLALHHASRGAEAVARTGASSRCVTLIRAHEAGGDDPALAALMKADDDS